ncbi:MAG: aldehyde dehydrogenase family protein [Alphaproteobacteria bacterium]|nr:aldehyde dehydrogenase family protein [Alphaproteobacteria bacterium]
MSLAEATNDVRADGAGTQHAMQRILAAQKAAFVKEGPPSAARRIEWLDRAIGLIVDHKTEIMEVLASDFGHRSHHQSLLADVFGSIEPLKHAKSNVRSWMRVEKRRPQFPLGLLGARAEVHYVPKGTVGVISPWNFPVNLTFAPLAGIFAAGNRAMIKPSEYTPATSELMARMFRTAFDETEVAVITGGPAVGEAFSRLAFDHLIFTGATSIAYHVMRAAAENLVPVTLELGGKSPVIVGQSADMADVARKVMTGKTLNAGQICLAPDYMFVPDGQVDHFVASAEAAIKQMYPTIKDNPDYTSVINLRHYDRLRGYIDEAKRKGAKVVEINPAQEDFTQQPYHKIPPTIVVDPTDDMKIMQDEIFGPLLPVKTYRAVSDAIDYVNSRPRPLGLYYFGSDATERDRVLSHTTSGGVTVNDVIMHVTQEDLPFGGVGPAGMGAYHGIDGFRTFSHAKAVFKQARIDVGAMLRPPYGEKIEKMLGGRVKR